MTSPYTPTPDERRVIAWLRKEAERAKSGDSPFVWLWNAAIDIEQGHHHD
jgi:hypothetical protein